MLFTSSSCPRKLACIEWQTNCSPRRNKSLNACAASGAAHLPTLRMFRHEPQCLDDHLVLGAGERALHDAKRHASARRGQCGQAYMHERPYGVSAEQWQRQHAMVCRLRIHKTRGRAPLRRTWLSPMILRADVRALTISSIVLVTMPNASSTRSCIFSLFWITYSSSERSWRDDFLWRGVSGLDERAAGFARSPLGEVGDCVQLLGDAFVGEPGRRSSALPTCDCLRCGDGG